MPDRFDILFQGATIYDGMGGAPFEGDVGVRNGKIAAVQRGSRPASAARTDARHVLVMNGKAIAP